MDVLVTSVFDMMDLHYNIQINYPSHQEALETMTDIKGNDLSDELQEFQFDDDHNDDWELEMNTLLSDDSSDDDKIWTCSDDKLCDDDIWRLIDTYCNSVDQW